MPDSALRAVRSFPRVSQKDAVIAPAWWGCLSTTPRQVDDVTCRRCFKGYSLAVLYASQRDRLYLMSLVDNEQDEAIY